MVVGVNGVSGILAADHVDLERGPDRVDVTHRDHSIVDKTVRDPPWKLLRATSGHVQVSTGLY